MKKKSHQTPTKRGAGSAPERVCDQVRVVIADDHVFMRDLMTRLLKRQFAVVGSVGTAGEAVSICARLEPDVLILDVNLPDQSGIEALPALKRQAPHTRVLLCTAHPLDRPISELVQSGAEGYVEKTSSWHDFLNAVDRISRGEIYFSSPSVGVSQGRPAETTPAGAPSASRLTPRETEIVTLLAHGLTSKEIAERLHISVATVDTHRTNVMGKLGLRNVAALVSFAFTAGLMRVSMSRYAGMNGFSHKAHGS